MKGHQAHNTSGNCLYASLSDQLFGTPTKHIEVRTTIVDYMRSKRDQFEHHVHLDDVTQRRVLRAPKAIVDDAFEGYLAVMSKSGSYGGEPEVVAFCQAYDQDVMVHLPKIPDFDQDSIFYRNEHRVGDHRPVPLHITYGGESTRAHYNSARSKGHGRVKNLNQAKFYDTGPQTQSTPAELRSSMESTPENISTENVQELLQDGRRELADSYDRLSGKPQTRSPSITSSQRSSSSKRSLDDDADYRPVKKADRRKSMKKREDTLALASDKANQMMFHVRVESPSPGTPASTQDTEYSSDNDMPRRPMRIIKQIRNSIGEEPSDSEASLSKAMRNMKPLPRGRKLAANVIDLGSPVKRDAIDLSPLKRSEFPTVIEARRTSLRQ